MVWCLVGAAVVTALFALALVRVGSQSDVRIDE